MSDLIIIAFAAGAFVGYAVTMVHKSFAVARARQEAQAADQRFLVACGRIVDLQERLDNARVAAVEYTATQTVADTEYVGYN